jgi:hypothetical protein
VIGSFFSTLFRYPDGIVLGNLIASLLWVLLAALTIWFARDFIGPRLVAWLHKHHVAHLESLLRSEADATPEDRAAPQA